MSVRKRKNAQDRQNWDTNVSYKRITRVNWWHKVNWEGTAAGKNTQTGQRRITDECHTVGMLRNKLEGKAVQEQKGLRERSESSTGEWYFHSRKLAYGCENTARRCSGGLQSRRVILEAKPTTGPEPHQNAHRGAPVRQGAGCHPAPTSTVAANKRPDPSGI